MVFVKVVAFVGITFCATNLLVPTQGLDCFACHSINGSDRRCEDPMIRIYEGFLKPETCALPTKIIHPAQKEQVDVMDMNNTTLDKGPGYDVEESIEIMESYCVKIIGTTVDDKQNIVIRTCIDQDLNSQCGILTFKEEKIRGCMLTCQDNMCNEASPRMKMRITLALTLILGSFFI